MFLGFIFVIQKMRFRNTISEKNNTISVVVGCIFYLILSAIAVVKLHIPFILAGFVNMFTMVILLKMISYSHVLF